jgi:hydroxyacyl-ACP dehydratase HTD2-like protein with hotdog domain
VDEARSWAQARARIEALLGTKAWADSQAQVRESDIVRYHEALGLPPPTVGPDGVMTAPPLFLPPTAAGGQVTVDGRRHRPGEVVIDVPGARRRVMGGCEVTFGAPIRAGETIRVSTTFDSVEEKRGSGGPMLLVRTATAYHGADGQLKRVERWTIVHR